MKFEVTEKGYNSTFGSFYGPEILTSNIEDLQSNYLEIIDSAAFRKEYTWLLKHYTGDLHHHLMHKGYRK
jgi:tryptophan synthase beta chain